jgi:hypothetical protein
MIKINPTPIDTAIPCVGERVILKVEAVELSSGVQNVG